MKTIMNLHFTCLLLLFSGILLFTGCQKNDDHIEPVIEEEVVFPDSIHDLVAYLSSSMEVLFVDPAYQPEVIELLGLFPTSDGQYELENATDDGITTVYRFTIVPIPAPELYFEAAPEMELEVRPTQDNNGVWYRVWRNAECGAKVKKKKGQCQELDQVDPATGAIAKQHAIEQEFKRCKKGDELCTEKLVPVGMTRFYDKLCKDEDTPDGVEVGTAEEFLQYRCDL